MHRLSTLLCLCLIAHSLHAAQTDNRGLHAVPTPAAVNIDGTLDDWDLSGSTLMCYDVETLRDVYSAQVALMHDADHLYVSLRWVDNTPLGNSHNPRHQPERGWAGDCVQLRIKTDRIAHVTAWCYGAQMEPAIHLDYGKDLTKPFGGGSQNLFRTEGWKLAEGAEMAFSKNADGKGYVQEIKLPWKLLTAGRTYKAGDRFNCGIELLWGEADWPVHRYADNLSEGAAGREFFFTNHPAWGAVILENHGNLKLAVPAWMGATEPVMQGPVAISYELPEDARVTLAINDAAGMRIRNLTPAASRKKGHNEERWDGLDDDGKSVPPGQYAFKGIYHQPIHVNWIMSFASPGNPTWQTPDGKGAFYGDHSGPQAVASAGEFVALACPIGEAGKHLIGCDLAGKRRWGLANRGGFFAGRISLATDGKLLWVAQDTSGTVYRVDIKTGQYAPWNRVAKDEAGHDYAPLDITVFDPTPQKEKGAPINLTSIAVRGDTLAVCLARDNKIRLFDASSGAPKGEIAVENPRAAAYDKDGAFLAISSNRLVRIDANKPVQLGEDDLTDAFGLAVDDAKHIYVSVRGMRQNVRVLDVAGKFLREIGKPGGRARCGPFDQTAMLGPAGIAIDSKGRLWVTEEPQNPKRTSVWNTTDGKLISDFVGTTAYAAAGAINPFDPTMGFSDNTVYRIDLASGQWRPSYSLDRSKDPGDTFPPTCSSRSTVRLLNGRQYVFTASTNMVRCMTMRDGRWWSCAAVGVVGREADRHFGPFWHAVMNGHGGQAFAWADLNGDGLTQSDELTFFEQPAVNGKSPVMGMYWGFIPDHEGVATLLSPASSGLLKFPITRWTDQGAPVYDATRPMRVPVDFPTLGANAAYVMGGKNGVVFINQKPLLALGNDGKVLWTYPSKNISVHGSHNATAARPGYLIGPLVIAGTADLGGDIGEVFDLNGNLGEHYLFTADGLYIQSIFKDTRGLFETPNVATRGMSMDMATSGGEDFGANFIRATDGKVYLTNGGTDARVHEITGLETIKRFAGQFTYSAEQYAQAQQLAQENAAKSTLAKSYTIERFDKEPKLDGKGTSFPELADATKPAIDIRETDRITYARVAARYDDERLCLAYKVRSSANRMRNAGQDGQLLFKSGDCVDVMLRADDGVKSPTNGIRLLISMLANKPVAILYEKSVPGTAKDARVAFSSPWRTIYFDRVRKLDDVKIAMAQAGGGYIVEISVPWQHLGIKPQSGLKLKGDIGVLFADTAGATTVSRQYWSNKNTGLVNDIPGEAELTPDLWGTLVLK